MFDGHLGIFRRHSSVAGALIATVIGLLVAIPARFAYNFMVTRIRAFTQELDAFSIRYATQIEHTYVDDRTLADGVSDAVEKTLKKRDFDPSQLVQAAQV